MSDIEDLIEAAQPNALLLRVNSLCEAREWDSLVDMAQRCRDALERGKQLWPIAEHIDYRLALEAPGEYAARVMTPDAGRFAHGPLTEVAASTHAFSELEPHLSVPQSTGVFAVERVIRGEDLRGRDTAHGEILELPLVLAEWEPAYALAVYKSDEVRVSTPQLPVKLEPRRQDPGEPQDEPEITQALLDLVTAWVGTSGATAEAVIVEGTTSSAVAALAGRRFFSGEITPKESFSYMAWAGASGGVHGRRRGAAAGRVGAWWAASVLSGCEWPAESELLGEEVARLRWYRWEPRRMRAGMSFYLAVEDPEDGWAVAVGALDPVTEDQPEDPG